MVVVEPANREIEVKFLEIDVADLRKKLAAVGATDLGEDHLTEIIFYDQGLTWVKQRAKRQRFVRLRRNRKGTFLTYKSMAPGREIYAEELETQVEDMNKASQLLEAIGLVAARHQEKKRHSYELDGVAVDIDTWPKIPTYVELEGPDEQTIKAVAKKLGFDWQQGVFDTAAGVIEKRYGLVVQNLKFFMFDKVE